MELCALMGTRRILEVVLGYMEGDLMTWDTLDLDSL